MVKVKITKNVGIEFYNERGRKEWYGSDLFVGQVMEFLEVDHATHNKVWFEGIDGELCSLDLNAFLFVEYQPEDA